MNREEKSHADWTNRHILEQVNPEEKKTKLSLSVLTCFKEKQALGRNTFTRPGKK